MREREGHLKGKGTLYMVDPKSFVVVGGMKSKIVSVPIPLCGIGMVWDG